MKRLTEPELIALLYRKPTVIGSRRFTVWDWFAAALLAMIGCFALIAMWMIWGQ